MILETFIITAKNNFKKIVMRDSLGTSLSFGQTLTASILLSNHIRNFAGENIAILFPPSVGGALAYIATALADKVPVGLNFLASKEDQNHVMELCGVKTIFTSRSFIRKAGIPEDPRMVFLEDIKDKISKTQKILTYLSCKFRSPRSLLKRFKKHDVPDKISVILFTSGSESRPKGVPLTNYNIYSSIQSFNTVFNSTSEDVFLGSLPFFHVFGFTVCLWLPLILGVGVFFHPNPTEYEKLGRIIHENRVTMLIGTSTLFRGFMKRWNKEQIKSVRLAFAGAEKLHENIRKKFYEKFGIHIFEGYGVTESCSCISVNHPNHFFHGSVGKIFPNITCKIVNPETYEDVLPGEEGLILVKGPNIMRGYYKSPDLTEQVFYNDFYITGDIGKLENGFLFITDRLKRFAKIGGEMVPLLPIENKLSEILDEHIESEKRNCAIVSIPHLQKGEMLVAFVVDKNPDKVLLNAKLDKLCVTKLSQPDHYISIESIPILPSGKVDYKRLKLIAEEQLNPDVSRCNISILI